MNSQPGVNSNPPNPASINEILDKYRLGGFAKALEYSNGKREFNYGSDEAKTALYTLIASVRPKLANKEATHPMYLLGYGDAVQDYDNAIKELFDE